MLLYLLSIAVSYLLAAFEASQEAERRGLQVQVLAREAELRSLRAQIDPHFLFNSLHSISALTAVGSAGCAAHVPAARGLPRDSLALGSEARITLERELRSSSGFWRSNASASAIGCGSTSAPVTPARA